VGVNGDMFDEFMAIGAVVAGCGTFEPAGGWGGDHHDGVPIFVLTREEPGSMGQMLLGQGRRLFDNLGPEHIERERTRILERERTRILEREAGVRRGSRGIPLNLLSAQAFKSGVLNLSYSPAED
jgi:hypothetical protein